MIFYLELLSKLAIIILIETYKVIKASLNSAYEKFTTLKCMTSKLDCYLLTVGNCKR